MTSAFELDKSIMSCSIPGGKGGMGGRGRYCKKHSAWGLTRTQYYCSDNGVGRRAASGAQGYDGEPGSSKADPFLFFLSSFPFLPFLLVYDRKTNSNFGHSTEVETY